MGAAVAGLAWRARSLSASGAVAAAALGTVAVAAGAEYALLLIFYFVSSTVLSRFGRRRKFQRTAGMVEKEGARDARQVLANGLVFAVACWMNVVSAPPELFLLFATGALTASAADTWATEIGTLYGGAPRSILTWRRLPVGASGGVSVAGTVASLAGAVCVGGFGVLMFDVPRYFPWIVLGGIAGSLVDSIAGALIQERRWCDACGSSTEMRTHACGTRTRRVGGIPFIENDAVNLVATAAGAVGTVLLVGAFA